MARFYRDIVLTVTIILIIIGLVLLEPEETGKDNFAVENFSTFSKTVNETANVFYLKENVSAEQISEESNVLNLNRKENLELQSIARQFGHSYDGGPTREEWRHALNYRTRYYLKNYDYFKYRDRYYRIQLQTLYPINSSLKVDGKLFDRNINSSDPAVIQLSLESDKNGNISIMNGPTLPLGLLNAYSKEDEYYLWSEMYESSKPPGTNEETITGWNQTLLSRDYSAEKPLKVNYTIRSDKASKPGYYRAEDSLRFKTSGSEGVLIYGVSFRLLSQ